MSIEDTVNYERHSRKKNTETSDVVMINVAFWNRE